MEPIESCTPTKKRQPNFSTNDCLLLIEIMGEDSGFERMARHVYLRHRFTDKITASSKKLLWKNISEIFTSKAHVKREWSELSKKWDNLVQKHRALYMDYVQSQQRTGGGPCSGSKLSVITDAVMAVVGKHSANVMGITGTAIGTNDTTWTALTSTMQSQTKCSDGMTESEWNTLSSRQHTAVPSEVSSAVPSAVPSALSSNTSMDIYEPLQDMNTSTATISTFDAGLGDVEQVLDNRTVRTVCCSCGCHTELETLKKEKIKLQILVLKKNWHHEIVNTNREYHATVFPHLYLSGELQKIRMSTLAESF